MATSNPPSTPPSKTPATPMNPATPERRKRSMLEHWPHLHSHLTLITDSDSANSSPLAKSSPVDIVPPAPMKKNICFKCTATPPKVSRHESPVVGTTPCSVCGVGSQRWAKKRELFAGFVGSASQRRGAIGRVLWDLPVKEDKEGRHEESEMK